MPWQIGIVGSVAYFSIGELRHTRTHEVIQIERNWPIGHGFIPEKHDLVSYEYRGPYSKNAHMAFRTQDTQTHWLENFCGLIEQVITRPKTSHKYDMLFFWSQP